MRRLSSTAPKIKRSTNSIADALQGVTIDLKTTTKAGEPQNPVIGIDKKRHRRQKSKEWVDNYNSLLDTFGSLTKYTPVKSGEAQSAKNGALLGDNTLRGIQSSIKKRPQRRSGQPGAERSWQPRDLNQSQNRQA